MSVTKDRVRPSMRLEEEVRYILHTQQQEIQSTCSNLKHCIMLFTQYHTNGTIKYHNNRV